MLPVRTIGGNHRRLAAATGAQSHPA